MLVPTPNKSRCNKPNVRTRLMGIVTTGELSRKGMNRGVLGFTNKNSVRIMKSELLRNFALRSCEMTISKLKYT